MTQRPKQPNRPTRFKVPNNEQVALSYGSERCSGTLCMLSVTGGTVKLHKPLPGGTLADANLKTVSGPVTAVIEILARRNGTAQAFRFVHIEPADRKRLESVLGELRDHGFGDKTPTPVEQVFSFARRLLPKK